MRRQTKLKALTLVLSVAVVAIATAFGTLAYFTSTDSVTNTFSVGNVKITMDEAKVKPDGTPDGADRVTQNTYKLMPGHTYKKDPTIHVDKGSESCYLFVRIENNIAEILVEDGDNSISSQLTENGWTAVDGEENVYKFNTTVTHNDDGYVVFENFTVKGDGVDNEMLQSYDGKTIVVTAYAVQADGFNDAKAAWDATFAKK